jgi:hypothetical protein
VLEDDELRFDPRTLQARRQEPVAHEPEATENVPPEEDLEEDAHAQTQGRFSLGE